ncbi:MAG: 16S rRNA pseudouridine(516) synthase RsuA [Gammaproteobacteria bacterium]|nr:16S rRNA pseudouridine(516) synthase RsuA [Gammaproteobacteria bacterium]
MRLDKYLSSVTRLTRSQAQRAIRQGRVRIADTVVKRPAMQLPPESAVTLDNEKLARPGLRYFMLNKPKGYVCSTHDKGHSSVLELLHEPVLEGLHFAGRLDIDTTGLVLITDDGAWSHRITSPRHEHPKTYLVTLAEPLSDNHAKRLSCGVLLHNEKTSTRPAELERLSESQIRLIITEGRYHQVKRMLAAVGNRVLVLHREAVSTLSLDTNLQPGMYRALTDQEIASVLRA